MLTWSRSRIVFHQLESMGESSGPYHHPGQCSLQLSTLFNSLIQATTQNTRHAVYIVCMRRDRSSVLTGVDREPALAY